MLTFKSETVDDINGAISRLARLPLRQQVAYLAKAKRKLLAWARRGDDVQDLRFRVHRMYAHKKRRYDEKQAQPEEKKPPYDIVDKRLYDLEVGEATRSNSERYYGLLVARDEDGFYVTDETERTESYSWSGAIPEEEILGLVDENNTDT